MFYVGFLLRRERDLKLEKIYADYQIDNQILFTYYSFVHTILFTSSNNWQFFGYSFCKIEFEQNEPTMTGAKWTLQNKNAKTC